MGLSCAFRQWRSKSQSSKVHGYALAFTVEVACDVLDDRASVMDLGSLDFLKKLIINMFDHTFVVADDDPYLDKFRVMNGRSIIDLRTLPQVGCEAFAERVAQMAHNIVKDNADFKARNVRVLRVICSEQGANSATYYPAHFSDN